MDISKKDLLKETGISYGQLYRWKREGLIPESWFVKKSTFTGQETYFPKEKILNRIHAIQQLKDQYSLEELANMLSPEITNRKFCEEDLEQFEEIDIEVAASFMDAMEKDEFTFVEVLVMMVLSEWRLKEGIHADEMKELIHHMMAHMEAMTNIEHRMLLLEINHGLYTLFLSEGTVDKKQRDLYLDERIHIKNEVHLGEFSNAMKMKYKDVFHFTFDEEMKK
ncbi:DUF4004 family protein [[Eubacterium] hominis]|uniref:DUF4004 family protein n=1 Tax=[Eubacterium] hominis TaxID=2764325 RepID=UPI003A4D2CDD